MTKRLALSVLFSFLAGCIGQVDESALYQGDVQDGLSRHCEEALHYSSEQRFKGTFVDSQFNPYVIQVDVDSTENYDISAQRVAELAYYLSAVHDIMQLPNNEKTRELLSNGHFVVVESDEAFSYLKGSNGDKFAAFIFAQRGGECWEVSEGANWAGVVKARWWDSYEPSVIVHEMIHVVSLATYGHSDYKHEEELLWDSFGQNTLMSIVLNEYDKEYNRPPFTNNPNSIIP
jgi:hypothetical protein